jgi:hypothetical protein
MTKTFSDDELEEFHRDPAYMALDVELEAEALEKQRSPEDEFVEQIRLGENYDKEHEN